MTTYIDVLISSNTDRLFSYSLPPELEGRVEVGQTVRVPFRNRTLTALVVEFVPKPAYPVIRNILAVGDEPLVFTRESVSIARQIADYYCCSFLAALYLFLPPDLDKKNKQVKVVQDSVRMVSLRVPPHIAADLINQYKKGVKTAQMAEVLSMISLAGGTVPVAEISQKSSLKSLITKDIVKVDEVFISRLSQHAALGLNDSVADLQLNEPQQEAIREILHSGQDLFLLHGVTGSGKTEVYLKVIEAELAQDRGAIVLVPEISLTPQTLSRFYARFGEKVAVMHSSLTEKERAVQWYRLLSGEARIVVGARSALFAPIRNLGIIIIDEEHETSYKQESVPRYSAITVAGWIARKQSAKLVLGSATPSVERYFYAQDRYLHLLKLPGRACGPVDSDIRIVDMRAEQAAGYSGYFSRTLLALIKQTLEAGEQIMLLLNRRGFSPFIICKHCGYKLTCPSCEVSLTLHNDNMLYCHYCGYKSINKPVCPECNELVFKYSGAGTQKLETELHSFFPKVRVLRMDRDSTGKLGSMEAILMKFAAGEADVLIGTQMIAKGHDFANVGLVGVLSADIALSLPDYRAAERTYSLLSQVAGRTGRRGKPGRVVIQTYSPENYAISLVKADDYEQFYEQEIEFRRVLDYPPFVRLARIILQSVSLPALQELSAQMERQIQGWTLPDAQIFGPMPAPLTRISGKHRWHLIIKSKSVHSLQKVVKSVQLLLNNAEKSVAWTVDIDPYSLL